MNARTALALGLAGSASAVLFALTIPIAGAQVDQVWIGLLLCGLIGSAAVAGWWGAPRAGLEAPIVAAWVAGKRAEGASRRLLRAAAAGLGLGVIGTVVALLGAEGAAIESDPESPVLPLGAGLVLALYGGIGEEVIFRFGLMSLVAGVAPPELRVRGLMVAAIGLSAFFFGILHAGQGVGDPVVQVLLRFAIGAAFGLLYWRQGLESAMAAHLAYNLAVFYLVVVVV